MGGVGGLKKLKKESAATSLRTVRVLPVAIRVTRQRSSSTRPPVGIKMGLTLVAQLLDLDLLGEVLALLPLDVGSDSLVVDKVSAVADLLLYSSQSLSMMASWF